MTVLLISQEASQRAFIANGLREQGRIVDEAASAADGFFLANEDKFKAIVIDRALPDLCGLSLLSLIRKSGLETPVVIIGSGADDPLAAFGAGADDFMRKPISVAELGARLTAIIRRGPAIRNDSVLVVEDLVLDRNTRQVWRARRQIVLQPRTFRLLEVLMDNAGSLVTRTMLLETVWDYHFDPGTSVVETHVSRLREKVDKPFRTRLIHTIRGGGYMIGNASIAGAA